MDYFALAADLARQEGAATLTRAAIKPIALKSYKNRIGEVCCCSAYRFPHRAGGGQCPAGHYDDQTKADWDAELLADFNRAEAQAINRSR